MQEENRAGRTVRCRLIGHSEEGAEPARENSAIEMSGRAAHGPAVAGKRDYSGWKIARADRKNLFSSGDYSISRVIRRALARPATMPHHKNARPPPPAARAARLEVEPTCVSANAVARWASRSPWRANSSARSFMAWPACPRTQCQRTRCVDSSKSRRCHRSTFSTGSSSAVRQPLRFHRVIHDMIPLRRY